MMATGEVVVVPAGERDTLAKADVELAGSHASLVDFLAVTPGRLARPVGAVAAPLLHTTVDTLTFAMDAGSRAVGGVTTVAAQATMAVASAVRPSGQAERRGSKRQAAADAGLSAAGDAGSFTSSRLKRAHSASDAAGGQRMGQTDEPEAASRHAGSLDCSGTPPRNPAGLFTRSHVLSEGRVGARASPRVRRTCSHVPASVAERLAAPEAATLRESLLQQQALASLKQLTRRETMQRPPELPHRSSAWDVQSRWATLGIRGVVL